MPGAPIKITTNTRMHVKGTLIRITEDTLELGWKSEKVEKLALSEIAEVQRGRKLHPRAIRTGVSIGLLAGTAVIALSQPWNWDEADLWPDITLVVAIPATCAMVGGFVGTGFTCYDAVDRKALCPSQELGVRSNGPRIDVKVTLGF